MQPSSTRCILRLCANTTFEMMYIDDVPTSVTINEAVELAKDFGGEDESHRFRQRHPRPHLSKMLEGGRRGGGVGGRPEVPADGDAASDGLPRRCGYRMRPG